MTRTGTNKLKYFTGFLYFLILAVMAAATILEKYRGTSWVSSGIYTSWWFSLLWAFLTVFAVAYFLKRKVKRPSVVALHLSFVIILAGALLTHVTAKRGLIHLRIGEIAGNYVLQENASQKQPLGFQLRLNNFEVVYHEGTQAAQDYQSRVTVIDGTQKEDRVVSMNKILSYKAVRLYQSGYDEDGKGTVLALNSDPFGIPVTYTGYGLLFLSLFWMLIDPKGAYRKVLRNQVSQNLRVIAGLLLLIVGAGSVSAQNTVPVPTARKMAKVEILYNDRICPLETFALDYTRKLYGKDSYRSLDAVQVLGGFLFWPEEWMQEPLLKVKGGELKTRLHLSDYVSVTTLFSQQTGYRLQQEVEEYYQGNQDTFHKQVAELDDKVALIMELNQGVLLKVFPYTEKGQTKWYAPADELPQSMPEEQKQYIRHVLTLVQEYAVKGDFKSVNEAFDLIGKYQRHYGGASLPSDTQIWVEHLYNAIPFAKILFMGCLTLGFLSLFVEIFRLTAIRKKESFWDKHRKPVQLGLTLVLLLAWLAMTLCLAFRWIISGTVPMANGYETMLFMAWLIMGVALLVSLKFSITLTFGFLLSGFFLLVAHLSNMDPQIGQIMPVLHSPLLTIHVSIIMMSYALLSMTFICGLTALLVYGIATGKGNRTALPEKMEALAQLSRLFLYPAMTALGLGIFIGAIWANVSWGTYWSWDPKEVWALITMMIYALALHPASLPLFRKPLFYHVFMTLAFLSILMTYFGVNYFLGGMHSYA